MTTVVAAAQDGVVVMAADTMTNVYDRPIIDGARKIRRMKVGDDGQALVAFAGCGGLVAAANGVHLDAAPPDTADPDELQEWAMTVAHAFNGWAVDVGITQDGRMDGAALFGYAGRLWTLSEVQAIPHPDGRAALGSGEGPAIGALDALLDSSDISIEEAVVRAVQVGIARDRYSAGPVQVERTVASGSGAPSPAPDPAATCAGGC